MFTIYEYIAFLKYMLRITDVKCSVYFCITHNGIAKNYKNVLLSMPHRKLSNTLCGTVIFIAKNIKNIFI